MPPRDSSRMPPPAILPPTVESSDWLDWTVWDEAYFLNTDIGPLIAQLQDFQKRVDERYGVKVEPVIKGSKPWVLTLPHFVPLVNSAKLQELKIRADTDVSVTVHKEIDDTVFSTLCVFATQALGHSTSRPNYDHRKNVTPDGGRFWQLIGEGVAGETEFTISTLQPPPFHNLGFQLKVAADGTVKLKIPFFPNAYNSLQTRNAFLINPNIVRVVNNILYVNVFGTSLPPSFLLFKAEVGSLASILKTVIKVCYLGMKLDVSTLHFLTAAESAIVGTIKINGKEENLTLLDMMVYRIKEYLKDPKYSPVLNDLFVIKEGNKYYLSQVLDKIKASTALNVNFIHKAAVIQGHFPGLVRPRADSSNGSSHSSSSSPTEESRSTEDLVKSELVPIKIEAINVEATPEVVKIIPAVSVEVRKVNLITLPKVKEEIAIIEKKPARVKKRNDTKFRREAGMVDVPQVQPKEKPAKKEKKSVELVGPSVVQAPIPEQTKSTDQPPPYSPLESNNPYLGSSPDDERTAIDNSRKEAETKRLMKDIQDQEERIFNVFNTLLNGLEVGSGKMLELKFLDRDYRDIKYSLRTSTGNNDLSKALTSLKHIHKKMVKLLKFVKPVEVVIAPKTEILIPRKMPVVTYLPLLNRLERIFLGAFTAITVMQVAKLAHTIMWRGLAPNALGKSLMLLVPYINPVFCILYARMQGGQAKSKISNDMFAKFWFAFSAFTAIFIEVLNLLNARMKQQLKEPVDPVLVHLHMGLLVMNVIFVAYAFFIKPAIVGENKKKEAAPNPENAAKRLLNKLR